MPQQIILLHLEIELLIYIIERKSERGGEFLWYVVFLLHPTAASLNSMCFMYSIIKERAGDMDPINLGHSKISVKIN